METLAMFAFGLAGLVFMRRRRLAEPKEDVRGDVARAWLYMSDGYNIRLSQKEREMFMQWHEADAPDDWERTRDERIEALQGNKNPYVRP